MYETKYEPGLGWSVFENGKRWSVFCFDTEWEAIEDLRKEQPAEAESLLQTMSAVQAMWGNGF